MCMAAHNMFPHFSIYKDMCTRLYTCICTCAHIYIATKHIRVHTFMHIHLTCGRLSKVRSLFGSRVPSTSIQPLMFGVPKRRTMYLNNPPLPSPPFKTQMNPVFHIYIYIYIHVFPCNLYAAPNTYISIYIYTHISICRVASIRWQLYRWLRSVLGLS